MVNTKNLNKIEQVTSLRQCFVIFLLLAVRDSEIRRTPFPFWVGRLRRFRQVRHAFWGVLAESSLLFSFFHLNSWTRRFCWCLHRWWLGGKRRQQLFSTAERAAGTWDVDRCFNLAVRGPPNHWFPMVFPSFINDEWIRCENLWLNLGWTQSMIKGDESPPTFVEPYFGSQNTMWNGSIYRWFAYVRWWFSICQKLPEGNTVIR